MYRICQINLLNKGRCLAAQISFDGRDRGWLKNCAAIVRNYFYNDMKLYLIKFSVSTLEKESTPVTIQVRMQVQVFSVYLKVSNKTET